ncbi:MAG TPA: hypothetical protein VLH16_01620 [Bacteroidales bacterium]|nr:hypothetical protein [Bacteroidales bacterium]
MITRYKIIFLIIITLTACSGRIEKEVVHAYPDGTPELKHWFRIKGDAKILYKETGYYPDGQLRIKGKFRDNQREGRWTYWHDNGNKWSEATFKAGTRHGKSTVWHENGEKYYEGFFGMDERTGTWRFWDTAGVLMKEIDYSE